LFLFPLNAIMRSHKIPVSQGKSPSTPAVNVGSPLHHHLGDRDDIRAKRTSLGSSGAISSQPQNLLTKNPPRCLRIGISFYSHYYSSRSTPSSPLFSETAYLDAWQVSWSIDRSYSTIVTRIQSSDPSSRYVPHDSNPYLDTLHSGDHNSKYRDIDENLV